MKKRNRQRIKKTAAIIVIAVIAICFIAATWGMVKTNTPQIKQASVLQTLSYSRNGVDVTYGTHEAYEGCVMAYAKTNGKNIRVHANYHTKKVIVDGEGCTLTMNEKAALRDIARVKEQCINDNALFYTDFIFIRAFGYLSVTPEGYILNRREMTIGSGDENTGPDTSGRCFSGNTDRFDLYTISQYHAAAYKWFWTKP